MTNIIFDEVTKWQRETFTSANSESKINHLLKEVEELKDSVIEYNNLKIKDSKSFMLKLAVENEISDCFILLFGICDSLGMTYDEIEDHINSKMIINKNRKWGPVQYNGIQEHIKD